MKALGCSFVWWPAFDRAIEIKVKHCKDCQINESNPAESLLHPWPITNDVWERVVIDYAEKEVKLIYLVLIVSHGGLRYVWYLIVHH